MKSKATKLTTILATIGLVAAACKPKAADDSGIRYVAPKDGLNMREAPSTTGKKMLTIPKGAQVQKLEEKPDSFTIDNIEGKWTKISWQGKTGWVFGGFLSRSEPASSAPTTSDVQDVGSLRSHFESLYFSGPGAQKSRGALEIRGLEFQCGGSKVTNVRFDENGLEYHVEDVDCEMHGRGNCVNCRNKNPRTCTVSSGQIMAVNSGGMLEGGACR